LRKRFAKGAVFTGGAPPFRSSIVGEVAQRAGAVL
jgi:hypothetical protein